MRMYKIFATVFFVLFLLVGVANASETGDIADNAIADGNMYVLNENADIQSNNGASNLNDDAVLSSDNQQSLEDSNVDLETLQIPMLIRNL